MADFYEGEEINEDTEKLPVEGQDGDILYIEMDDDEAEDEKAGENGGKKKGGFFADFFDCVETFCYALVLMMILFVFVFRFVTVNGTSMQNTLQDKDKLVISDVMYTPQTGDIVVLDADFYFQDKYIIKRVIATGGQKVEIDFDAWAVTVDGKLLNESYINRQAGYMKTDTWINTDESVTRVFADEDKRILLSASFTVPDGMVFVMGDNRNGSSDSRLIGCLEEERILGRVLFRISPNTGRVG